MFKGLCCEHIIYHRKNKELSFNYFHCNVEKTYDYGIERFKVL